MDVVASARQGKYTVLRHLASGGMAEIHLALTHGIEGFEKLVILKRILPHLARDEDFVRMFLNEARLAATLHHPNIVQVYDIGRDDHGHFFTMEFVYGADLSHILRRAAAERTPLALDQALTIILGMGAGLHHAHEKEGLDGKPLGMVHRDVSPQNVLVSYDGAVKLVDFGIAKVASRSAVTQDGALKGKIAYMSPEQCRARPLDRRSDVFSLSIMLWELTTFRRLFKAESDYEQLHMILEQDAPRPSQFRPDYPAGLERIVMKGLRRDPDERYQTVEELQLELEELAREQKLVISAVPLGRLVRRLFADHVDAWAAAQREGQSFPEFLATSKLVASSTPTDTWIAPPSGAEPVSPYARATPAPFDVPSEFPTAPVPAEISPEPRRRRWWPLVAGGTALAGGIGIAIALHGGTAKATSSTPPPDAAREQATTPAAAPPVPDAAIAASAPADAGVVAATPSDAAIPVKATPDRRTKPIAKPADKPPRPPPPPSGGLDDLLPH